MAGNQNSGNRPDTKGIRDTVIAALRGLGISQEDVASVLGVARVTVYKREKKEGMKAFIEDITSELMHAGLPRVKSNLLNAVTAYRPLKMRKLPDGTEEPDWDSVPLRERKFAIECGDRFLSAAGISQTTQGATVTHIVNKSTTIISPVVQNMLQAMQQRIMEIPNPDEEEGAA